MSAQQQPPTTEQEQAKEPELTDEQILEFEQRIKDEEALKVCSRFARFSCKMGKSD